MIKKEEVENIARLARLEVTSNKLEEYAKQLSSVMAYFDQIKTVETKGVEPLITPTEIEEFFRKDEVVQDLTPEEILANAPDKIGNLFRVPPVI